MAFHASLTLALSLRERGEANQGAIVYVDKEHPPRALAGYLSTRQLMMSMP